MKTLAILLMMALGAIAATNDPPTQAEQQRMFMEAVYAKQNGQLEEAATRFQRLIELQPENSTVKKMLAEVQATIKAREADPVLVLKRKLATTIIPEINFREAQAIDVVAFLRTACHDEINLIWQVPAEAQVGTVTLQLKQVSLQDVLSYVTQLAGLKYRIDAHAVVIYKPDATSNAKSE